MFSKYKVDHKDTAMLISRGLSRQCQEANQQSHPRLRPKGETETQGCRADSPLQMSSEDQFVHVRIAER